MATFDGWEDQIYGACLTDGQDFLMHFRTKGSKNGVRRFQNEDGTWTPLGLRERKEREGWGDKEARREAKRQAKAERKAQRAARLEAHREERRKSNPKTMTDAELKAAIERKKMETEYRELSKSPLLKTGEKLVSGYMDYRVKKQEAEAARKKMELEMKRMETEVTKSKERTKQTIQEAKKAESEAKKMAEDVKGGLKISRKADLKKAKTEYRGTTLRGNIARALGTKMNAGLKDKYTKIRSTQGQIAADKALKGAKKAEADAQRRAQEKQQKDQQREQEKERRRQERLMRQYGFGKGGKLN